MHIIQWILDNVKIYFVILEISFVLYLNSTYRLDNLKEDEGGIFNEKCI